VLEYTLAGYFGGFAIQNDNAVLTMSFRDTGGGILGTAMIGGVNSVDRNGLTGLQYRNVTAAVPIGTRDAALLLETFRRDGSYNDGYADNLSLEMSTIPTIPEAGPGPLAFLSLTILGCGLTYYRRKQCRGGLTGTGLTGTGQ
jgi:hypothetical protein